MINGSALLSLFGANTGTPAMNTGDTLLLYRTSISRADQETARLAKDPVVKRDLALLERAVSRAKTPQDLIKDPRALAVLLEGLGLGDQAQNPGLARAALLGDPKKSDALVNRLSDKRWKTAAERLAFATTGLATLRDPQVLREIQDGILKYRRITAISQRSQAVADAIYLKDMPLESPPGIYNVLGDTVLRRIATTVAGLPPELAVQEVEAQARTLKARFDVKQLADPKQRDALIQRYLITATLNNPNAPPSPLLSLFA